MVLGYNAGSLSPGRRGSKPPGQFLLTLRDNTKCAAEWLVHHQCPHKRQAAPWRVLRTREIFIAKFSTNLGAKPGAAGNFIPKMDSPINSHNSRVCGSGKRKEQTRNFDSENYTVTAPSREGAHLAQSREVGAAA